MKVREAIRRAIELSKRNNTLYYVLRDKCGVYVVPRDIAEVNDCLSDTETIFIASGGRRLSN